MLKRIILIVSLILFNFNIVSLQAENEIVREIFFPSNELNTSFVDSFGEERYGHAHEGIDIIGEQMMPLYAAVDGYISYITIPEASWGYHLTIKDKEDYTYHYLHINNDTPGTDDGQGGVENAFAPGIKLGSKVTAGQVVAYMGDSGNAEEVGHHLHFEIRKPSGEAINSYPSLIAALNPAIDFDPTEASLSSPDINTDKELKINNTGNCESNTLIKLANNDAVYYCGADGKRYAFPNDKIYFSWYENFSDIIIITVEEIAEIPLGGNVTYRPGIKMVKIKTDPKVYAVSQNGALRWIRSAESAQKLYGENWNQQIDDIPDSFFFNYKIGKAI